MLREALRGTIFQKISPCPLQKPHRKGGGESSAAAKAGKCGQPQGGLLLQLCCCGFARPSLRPRIGLLFMEPRPFLKRSETAAKAVCLTDRRAIAESEAFTGRGHMWFLFAILLSIIPRLVFAVIVFAKISGEVVFHIGFPQEKSARRAKKGCFYAFSSGISCFPQDFPTACGKNRSGKPTRMTGFRGATDRFEMPEIQKLSE